MQKQSFHHAKPFDVLYPFALIIQCSSKSSFFLVDRTYPISSILFYRRGSSQITWRFIAIRPLPFKTPYTTHFCVFLSLIREFRRTRPSRSLSLTNKQVRRLITDLIIPARALLPTIYVIDTCPVYCFQVLMASEHFLPSRFTFSTEYTPIIKNFPMLAALAEACLWPVVLLLFDDQFVPRLANLYRRRGGASDMAKPPQGNCPVYYYYIRPVEKGDRENPPGLGSFKRTQKFGTIQFF